LIKSSLRLKVAIISVYDRARRVYKNKETSWFFFYIWRWITRKLLMAQYRWINHTVRLAIQNLAIEHVVYAHIAWHKCLPLLARVIAPFSGVIFSHNYMSYRRLPTNVYCDAMGN